MSVVNASYDQPLTLEEHATMPLAGGLLTMGFQCGQVWGAALAAGARAYRLYGPGPQAETTAIIAAQRLARSFSDSYRSVNCQDVTQLNWKNAKAMQVLGYFLRGGAVRCFSMTAGYSRAARSAIDAVLSDDHQANPEPPVSCATLLARKMGASEMHATMAAGLAGGIGLSGGACGALGATIWLIAMKETSAGGKLDWNSLTFMEAVDRLLQNSAGEFECAAIVGRKFEDVHDHAAYLRAGGCAQIIEALAAQSG